MDGGFHCGCPSLGFEREASRHGGAAGWRAATKQDNGAAACLETWGAVAAAAEAGPTCYGCVHGGHICCACPNASRRDHGKPQLSPCSCDTGDGVKGHTRGSNGHGHGLGEANGGMQKAVIVGRPFLRSPQRAE